MSLYTQTNSDIREVWIEHALFLFPTSKWWNCICNLWFRNAVLTYVVYNCDCQRNKRIRSGLHELSKHFTNTVKVNTHRVHIYQTIYNSICSVGCWQYKILCSTLSHRGTNKTSQLKSTNWFSYSRLQLDGSIVMQVNWWGVSDVQSLNSVHSFRAVFLTTSQQVKCYIYLWFKTNH